MSSTYKIVVLNEKFSCLNNKVKIQTTVLIIKRSGIYYFTATGETGRPWVLELLCCPDQGRYTPCPLRSSGTWSRVDVSRVPLSSITHREANRELPNIRPGGGQGYRNVGETSNPVSSKRYPLTPTLRVGTSVCLRFKFRTVTTNGRHTRTR